MTADNIALLLVAALTAVIAGCGLKGDLYLEEPDQTVQQTQAAPTAIESTSGEGWVDRIDIEETETGNVTDLSEQVTDSSTPNSELNQSDKESEPAVYSDEEALKEAVNDEQNPAGFTDTEEPEDSDDESTTGQPEVTAPAP